MTRPSRRYDRRFRPLLAGMGLLGLCAVAAVFWPAEAAAALLFGWWLAASLCLGAQANLWMHDLTGGQWGEALRPHLLQARAGWPLLSVLLLPLLLAIPVLYPWAQDGWHPATAQPRFQALWLSYGFVAARLVLYAGVFNVLMFALPRLREKRSDRRCSTLLAATGLIAWACLASLLGVDLIMSLTPRWYSSGFGLVVLAAQMKLGFAWGVLRAASDASPAVRRDLGNLLLTSVLMWAYVAWVQFQIIWAEDLPDEIVWYIVRLHSGWAWAALALVATGLFMPVVLLLFRSLKEHADALRGIAALIGCSALIETLWLILPSTGVRVAIAGMLGIPVLGGLGLMMRGIQSNRSHATSVADVSNGLAPGMEGGQHGPTA